MQPSIMLALQQFAALSDRTRLRVVRLLWVSGESTTLSTLARALGVEVSLLSKHMKVLASGSLLSSEKRGRDLRISAYEAGEAGGLLQAAVMKIDDSEGIFASDLSAFQAAKKKAD